MASRLEQLADGSKVLYLDIGNLNPAYIDEYCQNVLSKIKKSPDETVYLIPIRSEPREVVYVYEKKLAYWIIGLLAGILFVLLF